MPSPLATPSDKLVRWWGPHDRRRFDLAAFWRGTIENDGIGRSRVTCHLNGVLNRVDIEYPWSTRNYDQGRGLDCLYNARRNVCRRVNKDPADAMPLGFLYDTRNAAFDGLYRKSRVLAEFIPKRQ